MRKFEETGVATNIERLARSAENIAIVSDNVAEDSNTWFSGVRTVLWHIMVYFALRYILHPHTVQFTQHLKPADHLQRRKYVEQNFLQR